MKKIISIVYLIILTVTSVFALQSNLDGLKLSINYYDKHVYYPESDIKIKITVSNGSPSSFTFDAAEIYSYNFLLTVKTLKNQPLDPSQKYIIQHNSNKPVFYRQITLLPGEDYSFTASLSDYSTIKEPGIYIVQGVFYPDFKMKDPGSTLYSNILTLPVRPGESSPTLKEKIDSQTGEILKRTALPPDQVVSYVITARQKNDWNRFFLYLDLESLMTQEPRLEAKYRNSSEGERLDLLDNYKESLRNQVVDNDILLVPDSFEILNTTYTPLRGKVLVREFFNYRTYKEIKEYTYFLHRKEGFWTIYNYEIRNIGTE